MRGRMPSEYQGYCSKCGHKGPVMGWGYQALVVDVARVIELPHPNEVGTLREHKTSFFRAGVRGRYARVDRRVCLDCGAVTERASLGFPFTVAGCLLIMALLSVLSVAGALAGVPFWALPFVGIGSWLAFTLLAARVVRVVFRKRQRALPAGASCLECGGTRLRDIASALVSDLPCPHCKARSFRIHAVELVPDGPST